MTAIMRNPLKRYAKPAFTPSEEVIEGMVRLVVKAFRDRRNLTVGRIASNLQGTEIRIESTLVIFRDEHGSISFVPFMLASGPARMVVNEVCRVYDVPELVELHKEVPLDADQLPATEQVPNWNVYSFGGRIIEHNEQPVVLVGQLGVLACELEA